jgi:Transcriptional regulatory protein, C terminal
MQKTGHIVLVVNNTACLDALKTLLTHPVMGLWDVTAVAQWPVVDVVGITLALADTMPPQEVLYPTLVWDVDIPLPITLMALKQTIDTVHDSVQMGPFCHLIGSKRLLVSKGTPIMLTEKETTILRCLKYHYHEAASKETLLSILGWQPDVETRAIETHIWRLRQKLEGTTLEIESVQQGWRLVY